MNVIDKYENGTFLLLEPTTPPRQGDIIEVDGKKAVVKEVIVGRLGRVGVKIYKGEGDDR